MISLATPRHIAGKIAGAHNRRECRACRRPLEGGVLAFGLSGSDARWYPDPETARRESSGPRYVFPIGDADVTPDQVLAWLESQRNELDQLIEHVERQREDRRMRREYLRTQEGWTNRGVPCTDCGKFKPRPADRCEYCGDEPCPAWMDPHAYNREHGFAF